MGDIDGGDSKSVLDLLDDGSHLDPELCIEVRKRLVHEKDLRLDCQSSGKGDSLLLSAGELLGETVGILRDLHQGHELFGLGLYLFFRKLLVLESESNVLSYCEVWKDCIVLEHHSDVSLRRIKIIDQAVTEVEGSAFD